MQNIFSSFKKILSGKKKTIGLALGSGAGRGFAHIGVIKTLEKNNIPIDYISGTSMGAIIAAHYALFKDINKLEELAISIKSADIISLIDLNNPLVSFIKGQKVRQFLTSKLYGEKTFSDTKIPLRISATTLEEGKSFIFKNGSIIDAVIASGTLPGIFPATEKDGKHLIDGGLVNGVPVDLLNEFNPDIIIAVDLYTLDENYRPKNYNLRQVIDRTYRIYISRLSDFREKEYKNNVIIIKPKIFEGLEALSFVSAEKNIKKGSDETEIIISKIQKMLE